MGKIVIPPSASSTGKKGTPWEQFVLYWGKKYPAFKQNEAAIYAAAKAEHIDPVLFGSLILNESGGNFNVGDSSKGAVGIGQLLPSSFIGKPEPWNPHHIITAADLRDRGINLRLSANYFGQMQGSHPDSPYGAYNAGPNATPQQQAAIQQAWVTKWITPWNPKYVSTAPTSPPGKAGQQVPGGTAPSTPDITYKDPFVVGVNKQGKMVTTFNPNKAMQYDGIPMSRSNFLTLRDQLTSHYISYTGQRPSAKQIANYVQNGWNPYTLDVLLSKSHNFTKSPIYKQYAANYGAAVKDILAPGGKVPVELLRQAVVNNWDQATLAAALRKQPTYLQSNEFKGNVATLLNVHDSIMGNATPNDMLAVKDAALAGWTADQYAAYLRQQPTYTHSTEYQSKALGFMGALGLITGDQATLSPGVAAGPGVNPATTPNTQKLPQSKLLPGVPTISTPLAGLGVTA